MKVLLATDAWQPQVNGVVRTLSTVFAEIQDMGHEVLVIHPGDFPAIPLPTYSEIKLVVWMRTLWARIEAFDPDVIHIATEGPIGWKVRRGCMRRGLKFTTSLHTRFPEYVAERCPVPLSWSYGLLKRFHAPAERTLVPTASFRDALEQRGLQHLEVWGRGVDVELFRPGHRTALPYDGPVLLNVGRLAPEKNLLPFLELKAPGTKIMVGDGPLFDELKAAYPDVIFPGYKHGKALAQYYASADVFVFPSLLDTFGLVMIEAIACGTPVAAFPVTGPKDVITPGVNGELSEDLGLAVERALTLDRAKCAASAESFTWRRIATQMLQAFVPASDDKTAALQVAHG